MTWLEYTAKHTKGEYLVGGTANNLVIVRMLFFLQTT